MKVRVWKLFVFVFVMVSALAAPSAAHALGVTSTIRVGGAPWGVAYDSGKGEIFLVNSGTGTVSVMSDSKGTVLTRVTVGLEPYRVTYDSGQGEVFVANYGANSVSVISDKSNSVVATIPVGTHPSSFAYDSGKGEVFVANSGFDTVSVISDVTNTVVATVTVGAGPFDLAYDAAKGEVFVSNYVSGTVSVISDVTNTVVATVTVGGSPLGVGYDPSVGEIFVVGSGSGAVSVVSDSSNSIVATVTVGTDPGPIAYDSGREEMFVANRGSGSVSVISDKTDSVVATIAVGNRPYGEAYDSARGEIFVSNYADGTVSVISDSQAAGPSSTSGLLQQVWVPKPTNAAAAVAASAVIMGAASLVFAAISNPLGGLGGSLAKKTKDVIPDNVREWLEEVVSSKSEETVVEKTGYLFRPTTTEALAYVVSVIVLALSFSYVKVVTLGQIWAILPVFLATSILVGFVQEYVSIVYLRSKGIWSEEKIWFLGLLLFAFTTFAFRVPFSQPTRSTNSKETTERLDAIASASQVLVSLAFAGLFFLALKAGYAAVGGAGLAMCVIMSFVGTFPVAPMSGKDIFDHSKSLWAGLFFATAVIFAAWLLLL
jgi:YVTN family beta-propeller protein